MLRSLLIATLLLWLSGCTRTARPQIELDGYETRTWVGSTTTTLPGAPRVAPAADTMPPEGDVPSPPPKAPARGWERAKPW